MTGEIERETVGGNFRFYQRRLAKIKCMHRNAGRLYLRTASKQPTTYPFFPPDYGV